MSQNPLESEYKLFMIGTKGEKQDFRTYTESEQEAVSKLLERFCIDRKLVLMRINFHFSETPYAVLRISGYVPVIDMDKTVYYEDQSFILSFV